MGHGTYPLPTVAHAGEGYAVIELVLKVLLLAAVAFIGGYFWTRAADEDEAKFQQQLRDRAARARGEGGAKG